MVATNDKNTETDFFTLKDLMQMCLARWHWFAISIVLTLFVALIYIATTPPVYERTASVLIKDDTKGGSLSSDVSGLSDIGLFQSNVNVNNEIVSLRSESLMSEVVERLRLDVDYKIPGRFYDEVIYGPSLPVDVWFETVSPAEEKQSELVIHLPGGGGVRLSEFNTDGEDFNDSHDVTGSLLDTLTTPLGRVVVSPTRYYDGKWEQPIGVIRSNPMTVTHLYRKSLRVGLNAKETTIVDLSLRDISARRAEDVLNTLIEVYNKNWVDDKNHIAVNTSLFINERLGIIERELGDVDENIASFKSENLVPDVAAVSAMYMTQSKEVTDQLHNLNNRISMARYILRYIADSNGVNQLLPASSGIESTAIEAQISEYNTVQLRRNDLVANSSEQNPLVVDLDLSLEAMRGAVVTSVENHISTLDEHIRSLQAVARQTTSRISESPSQAKDLLTVERQQKVKEALYLFLLQKREENELSQTFAADNTRIVQAPIGEIAPVAPQKRNILLAAFMIGMLIPTGIIFLRENFNTTVRGRKDLEGLSLPFIGEIPLISKEAKSGCSGWLSRFSLRGKSRSRVASEIVVENGKRDVVNEAFRVLRTNLEFIAGQDGHSNVITVTSFNAGSGKSLITTNISVSLAIKGKKVLVIDGDMRHASLSKLVGSPKSGLSNILNGEVDNPYDCVVTDSRHDGLSILPVGTIPPNPTELLETGRLTDLIARFRVRYDYIFIDCPPVDIVADVQIIEKQATRTIFIVRAGLLDRSMLPELESFYTRKRFKNMVAVLNATPTDGGPGSRYGYRYGYHGDYYKS